MRRFALATKCTLFVTTIGLSLALVSCGTGSSPQASSKEEATSNDTSIVAGQKGSLNLPSREFAKAAAVPDDANGIFVLDSVQIYAKAKSKELADYTGNLSHKLKSPGNFSNSDDVQQTIVGFDHSSGKDVQLPINIILSESITITDGQLSLNDLGMLATNLNSLKRANWTYTKKLSDADFVFVTEKVLKPENELERGIYKYNHLERFPLEVRVTYASEESAVSLWGIRSSKNETLIFETKYVLTNAEQHSGDGNKNVVREPKLNQSLVATENPEVKQVDGDAQNDKNLSDSTLFETSTENISGRFGELVITDRKDPSLVDLNAIDFEVIKLSKIEFYYAGQLGPDVKLRGSFMQELAEPGEVKVRFDKSTFSIHLSNGEMSAAPAINIPTIITKTSNDVQYDNPIGYQVLFVEELDKQNIGVSAALSLNDFPFLLEPEKILSDSAAKISAGVYKNAFGEIRVTKPSDNELVISQINIRNGSLRIARMTYQF